MQLTPELVRLNHKESVKRLLSNQSSFHLMSSMKIIAAYWKEFLHEVRAMVKQLEIINIFLTLPCADLRWDELSYIINRLKNLNLSDEEVRNLTYQRRTKLLNDNPVLIPRYFQYKLKVFFKEIVLDGPLDEMKYYALSVEFKESGSLHVYDFV